MFSSLKKETLPVPQGEVSPPSSPLLRQSCLLVALNQAELGKILMGWLHPSPRDATVHHLKIPEIILWRY